MATHFSIPKEETDLSLILRLRLENIKKELEMFHSTFEDFSKQVDVDLNSLCNNMGRLQKNLKSVHMVKEQ